MLAGAGHDDVIPHDVLMWSPADFTMAATYDVGSDFKTGLAVNADGSMMAVSFNYPFHEVHLFRLAPSFEQVCVIGREGSGPAEFKYPCRLCFTDDDTIRVCDRDDNRLKQFTVAGEYISSFIVQKPFSIAVHGDKIAVGTADGPIEIHSLATGELIRRFGSSGDGPAQIGGYASGIRFTPDGSCLLVAENGNGRLTLFSSDGMLLKRIGAGLLAAGPKDVSFGAGGEIIAADCGNHCISVFSADGDTLIKTLGEARTVDALFKFPNSLAVAGSFLFVMDVSRRVCGFKWCVPCAYYAILVYCTQFALARF